MPKRRLLGELAVVLTAIDARFKKSMEGASRALDAVSNRMSAMGRASAALAAGIGFAGFKVVSAASDAEESLNLLRVSFGDLTPEVLKWARATGSAMGRSQHQMREFAGSLQAMLSPMVGSTDKAAEMSMTLSALSVDLGSFFNVADSEALTRLKSGLTGEMEPLRKFGIVMSVAALDAFALAEGLGKTTKEMTEAEKVALRYRFILDKTRLAQGDAIRTSGSFANQLKRFKGQIRDLAVDLGERLLPVASRIVSTLQNVVGAFNSLSEPTKNLALKIALVVGALAVLGTAFIPLAGVASLLAGIASAAAALSGPFLAVMVIVASLVALFGALRIAWKENLGGIREGVGKVKDWMRELLEVVINLASKWIEAGKTLFRAFKNRDFDQAKKALEMMARAELDTFKEASSGQDDGLVGEALGKGQEAAGSILREQVLPALKSAIDGIKESFVSGLSGLVELVPADVREKFAKMLEELKEKFGGLLDSVGKVDQANEGAAQSGNDLKKTFDLLGTIRRELRGAARTAGGILGSAFGGPASSVFEGAKQGFESGGGPLAALAGALAALLAESEAFKAVVEFLNNTVLEIANALGEALRPLVPLIVLYAQATKLYLMPALLALTAATRALTPIFKIIFNVMRAVMIGVLKIVKKALSLIGARSKAVNEAMDELKSTTWDTAGALGGLKDTAEDVSEKLTNVPDGFKIGMYRWQARLEDMIDGFEDTFPGTPGGGGGGAGGGTPEYKPGGEEYQSYGSASSSSGGTWSRINVEGDIVVVSDDPAEVLRLIEQEVERKAMRRHGTTVMPRVGR